jgi:hypothetical protein
MPLTKASSTVIQSIYASQLYPSGAQDNDILKYEQDVTSWLPARVETSVKNSTAATYQLTVSDADCVIRMSRSSEIVVNVPNNNLQAFKTGTQIIFVQEGTGQIRFTASTGVSLVANENRYKTYGQWSGAALIKLDTNLWFLGGDISDI